jgi:hypothetical protein
MWAYPDATMHGRPIGPQRSFCVVIAAAEGPGMSFDSMPPRTVRPIDTKLSAYDTCECGYECV